MSEHDYTAMREEIKELLEEEQEFLRKNPNATRNEFVLSLSTERRRHFMNHLHVGRLDLDRTSNVPSLNMRVVPDDEGEAKDDMPLTECWGGCPHYFSSEDAKKCPFGEVPTSCPCIGLEQRGWLMVTDTKDNPTLRVLVKLGYKEIDAEQAHNARVILGDFAARNILQEESALAQEADTILSLFEHDHRCLLEALVMADLRYDLLLEPVDAKHVGSELVWLTEQDGNVGTAAFRVLKAFAQKNVKLEGLRAREVALLDIASRALWENAAFGTEHFYGHDSKQTRQRMLQALDRWEANTDNAPDALEKPKRNHVFGKAYDCKKCERTHPPGPCENFKGMPLTKTKEALDGQEG